MKRSSFLLKYCRRKLVPVMSVGEAEGPMLAELPAEP